jgi:HSP20 family protein
MTLVRFNNKPVNRTFNNLMDDFFTTMPSIFNNDLGTAGYRHYAPVNITETENDYVLELVAPGLEKEDFSVNLDKNILTISAEKKVQAENENGKVIRQEFRHQSFKRSFTVDEKIDAQNIVAKYINGVLTLNLPKKPEVKQATKQITIQ